VNPATDEPSPSKRFAENMSKGAGLFAFVRFIGHALYEAPPEPVCLKTINIVVPLLSVPAGNGQYKPVDNDPNDNAGC